MCKLTNSRYGVHKAYSKPKYADVEAFLHEL